MKLTLGELTSMKNTIFQTKYKNSGYSQEDVGSCVPLFVGGSVITVDSTALLVNTYYVSSVLYSGSHFCICLDTVCRLR